MIEDKQIKELAKDIKKAVANNTRWFRDHAISLDQEGAARDLYNAGYCKASEIFEAADELINTICAVTGIELTAVGGKYLELRNNYSGKDINVPTKEDKKTCEGCCNIAFRYPYASMYPCINCVRANQKDYYNVPVED